MADKEMRIGNLAPADKDILEIGKSMRNLVRSRLELWMAGQDMWTLRASKNQFDPSWNEKKILCKLSFGCCACADVGAVTVSAVLAMSYDLEVYSLLT